MRQLKPKYQKLRDDFAEELEHTSSCSCHINPPCGFCTHEGNPTNLEDNPDAWEYEDMPLRSDGHQTVETAGPVELNRKFKTVGVTYASSPSMRYTFMTDEECKIGDKAVVFTNGNWNVVTIMEIYDKPQLDGGHNYTWLVQVIDRTNYDRHVKEDGEGYPTMSYKNKIWPSGTDYEGDG